MADYIITYSKVRFTPLEPRMEDIKAEDIAHALSLMTRANGHFSEFYSVAQHSLNCKKEAEARGYSKRVAAACLLHDASEAYLSDITRPVKKNLGDYHNIEARLQNLVYKKFLGDVLTEEEGRQVDSVDDGILYYEFHHYMDEKLFPEVPVIKSSPDFEWVVFREAEQQFLKELDRSIKSMTACEN